MDSQHIVDYISGQLRAGHSEARLREHLAGHGWQPAAVDAAFEQYYRSAMPLPVDIAPSARKHRVRLSRWTRAHFIKLGVAGAAVVIVIVVGLQLFQHSQPKLPARKPQALAYKQKQSIDILLLAGAINNFIAGHAGVPPTATSVTPDGVMVLCGTVCDPGTDSVSALAAYKPDGVRFMAYSSGLAAPDVNTMYIVPDGSCANANELGGQNVNPRAMVILYGRADDNGVAQRCVTL